MTAPDPTLADLYTALAEAEGAIAGSAENVRIAKANLEIAVAELDGHKARRSELHKAIRAKKARAKPADTAAAPAGNADPAMPAHLRRSPQ